MCSSSGHGRSRTGSRRASRVSRPRRRDLLRAAAILGDRTELSLAAALAGTWSRGAAADGRQRTRSSRSAPAREPARVHTSRRPQRGSRGHERRRAHERAPPGRRDAARARGAAGTGRHLPRSNDSRRRSVRRRRRCGARRSGRLAQGAPEAAAAYLPRALEEPPADEERAEVLGELGIAETQADVVGAASTLSQAIVELAIADARYERTSCSPTRTMLTIIPAERAGESAELLQETE